jgi:GST-like protein
MPALVDPAPADGSGPLAIFESGAILLYLAEKTGQFLPADLHGRMQVIQWLFWQMSSVGPTLGQNHHFVQYAPEKVPYAIDRFVKESARLYAVLDKQLRGREFIAGEYSIADMACYPWMSGRDRQQIDIEEFSEVKRWLATVRARPATKRAYARGKEVSTGPVVTEEARRFLFGQDASTVRGC